MQFCAWYEASSIASSTPDLPGVFQIRGPDLQNYPQGKSAMIHYGCAAALREALLAWAGAQGRDGDRFRHALDLGRATPEAALERLTQRFVARFGEAPRRLGEAPH